MSGISARESLVSSGIPEQWGYESSEESVRRGAQRRLGNPITIISLPISLLIMYLGTFATTCRSLLGCMLIARAITPHAEGEAMPAPNAHTLKAAAPLDHTITAQHERNEPGGSCKKTKDCAVAPGLTRCGMSVCARGHLPGI